MTANEQTPGADDDAPTGARCGNCSAALRGPHCHRCGQPVKGLVRHFSTFLGDAVDTLFNIDSRIPQTLWPLFAKPGRLTLEYFAGRRVRYVSPVRLFYLLAILAFFVGSLVVSFGEGMQQDGEISNASTVPEVERIRDGVLRDLQRTRADLPKQPGADAGVIAAEVRVRAIANSRIAEIRSAKKAGRPVPVDDQIGWDVDEDPITVAWLPAFANDWLNRQAARTRDNLLRLREDPEPFKAALMGAVPVALSLLLPVFALMLKLAYVFRRRLYMEHLIVALHSHAFICLVLLMLFLLSALREATTGFALGLAGWAEGLLWVWMLLYLLLMQKRVYGQGWPMTILKYVVLGNVYFVLLGVFAGGAALASLVWM